MADEQKPDLSLLVPAIPREVASEKNKTTKILSQSPSFKDWTNNSSIKFPGPPTSSPKPQNQMGQVSIKNEPWSPSSEVANPQSLPSAFQGWIGPTKLSNDGFQIHSSSHVKPTKAPFSTQSPKLHSNTPAKFPTTNITQSNPNKMEHQNRFKLFAKPSIPTRPRSHLKRKTRGSELFQPHQIISSPSTSNSMIKIKNSADNLRCEICQVICSSALTMQQHLNGRPHKAKLKYMQLKRACKGERKGKPRCDVCEIWCSDIDGLNMHFKGQKHKAKLQELELCRRNGGERISKTPIFCELCVVHCMNEDLYKMHAKGRQHAAKEELRSRGIL